MLQESQKIQSREELARDYKATLEGLVPICEKYIETTSQLIATGSQLQNLFIQLKSQSKAMIAGVDEQLQLLPDDEEARRPEKVLPESAKR